MEKKVCCRCKDEKGVGEFHAHPKNKDGLQGACKKCIKDRYNARIANEPGFVDKVRKNSRQRYKRIGPAAYQEEIRRPWTSKCAVARNKLRRQYKGQLPKGAQFHHWSYKEEHLEDVIILMRVIHKRIHSLLVLDVELAMFRTLDGELLDTKEKHLDYISPHFMQPIPDSLKIPQ